MDYKALGKAAIQGIGLTVVILLVILGIAWITALIAAAFGGIVAGVVTFGIILSIWFTVLIYILNREY